MKIFNSVEIMVRSIEKDKDNGKSFVKREIKYQLINDNEKIKEIIKKLIEIKGVIVTEKEEEMDLMETLDDLFNF